MSVIEMHNIRKFYGSGAAKVEILHGLELIIEAGEFVAITGPSGSGKSTLMNIIGLLDVPDEGSYNINGLSVSSAKDSTLANLRLKQIGFVFQSFNLISSLSALENTQIPLVYSKIRKSKRRQRATQLLEYVGLGERMRAKPNELSGGQQQRVAIARALINQPSLVLADEPTGNLDTKSGQSIMEVLKSLNQIGVTVVMITHDPNLAQQASRIIVLKDGAIISDKPTLEPVATPAPSLVTTVPPTIPTGVTSP